MNQRKSTILLAIIAIVSATAMIISLKKTRDGNKQCAEELIAWWQINKDYQKANPNIVPGTPQPDLRVRLIAYATSTGTKIPASRCPVSGKAYLFQGTNPTNTEIPAACPHHTSVLKLKY